MRFDRILVPVDFSASSQHALHYAIDFAKRFNSALDLVHVVEIMPVLSYVDYEGIDLEGFQEQLQKDADSEFDRWLRETPDLGDLRSKTHIRRDVPYLEVIDASKDYKSDLIILATHGRSGLSHFLLGSVAEKVVRNSPCPVLTVKKPDFHFEQA